MTFHTVQPTWFQGQVSLEAGEGWVQPWRLPEAQRGLFPSPDDSLVNCASTAAGVRLRLRTTADTLTVQVEPWEDDRPFDLVVGNTVGETFHLPPGESDLLIARILHGEIIELWLPQTAPVRVRGITLADDATLEIVPDKRRRWVTYGSSITHCGAAHSPARTWPAIAARQHDLHLTCMGFGGQCHLDPMIGRVIRDLPAEVITLKLGINVQGAGSLSPRTFKAAAIGLVQIIREKHPTTPIGILSPIFSRDRETVDNHVGFSVAKMRAELFDAVARLRDHGDECIHYFDGLTLIGAEDADYLPDDLHPNGDGYELLGKRVAETILPTLL